MTVCLVSILNQVDEKDKTQRWQGFCTVQTICLTLLTASDSWTQLPYSAVGLFLGDLLFEAPSNVQLRVTTCSLLKLSQGHISFAQLNLHSLKLICELQDQIESPHTGIYI